MTTLIDCPQSSRGQWSFRLFGVPVHVKFWFWITVVILGGNREAGGLVIWAAVCFFSILLHELGHVYAFRAFGERAEVVLYGWGGLAVPDRPVRTPLAQFVVALAGPAAGFGLAGLAMAAAWVSGATIHFGFHMFLPTLSAWPALAGYTEYQSLPSFHWYMLLNDLLFVNFYWGLVNLLPVFPLDGGNASRAVFEQHDALRGKRHALILSAIVAAAVALLGLGGRSLYMAVMFGILAVSSLHALQSNPHRVSPRPYRSWRG
ncbi:MAG: hypothetical protein LAQ69_07720 [Acidobacteriia bacterium]|nr:hypothetical protein [Terriglobia bacterium]